MPREKRRKLISNIILIVAIAVFLFSCYQLYTIYMEYHKGEEEYEHVIEQVITEEVETIPNEEDENKEEEKVVFKVDFDKLLSINSETVAWIRFDEPSRISYPVVQAKDNDKYLTTTFEKKKNAAGALFVDANNMGDFTDRNTFIYGHNMKNGSMFGQLRKYKSADFCKQYPYFYIYTPDGKIMQYQIFAVGIVEDTAESYMKFYSNEEEYEQYLDHIQSIARYDTGVEVTAGSQIVSLSTCTNVTETQRLLVHGVKISEEMMEE